MNVLRVVKKLLGIDEIDEEAAERAAQRLAEQRAAQTRANQDFDRHPDERDQLPGSPRAHRFRRRRGWLT